MHSITLSLAAVALGGGSAFLVNCTGEGVVSSEQVAPADAQSRAITAAAHAFLGSLSDDQRRAATFAWDDDEQRAKWSNFPPGLFKRTGIDWMQLSEPQRAALMDLLGTILSPKGVQMVRDQMAADDVLASRPQQGPRGGGPPPGQGQGNAPPAGASPGGRGPREPLRFGSDFYFVSFVGEPSTDAPWMLQFGGHHLAINATVAGPRVTITPSLTGGQPLRFIAPDDQRQVYLTKDEIDAAHALVAALTPEQRQEAIRSDQPINLVAGAQQDDVAVPAEGLSAAKLDAAQQARLMALIEARLGILNDDDRGPLLAEIRQNLPRTTFGWWGPVEEGQPAYWRIVGPTLVQEYSPQQLGADDPTQHAHNMYRWPGNDYGRSWTAPE